jgi:DNA-binding MurR/RpiR family transcriptional regulator
MIKIDETKLNPLERRVLTRLTAYAKKNPEPKIVGAAAICDCSVSQVSKAIKKTGFKGYKQFIRYLYFGDAPQKERIDELERLKIFIEEFDLSLLDEFVELILSHKKIILFGYGPSFICAQYIEYKLRFCTDAFITTPPDERSLHSLTDAASLLIILTTTGQYRSFEPTFKDAKESGADVIVVSEEFNSLLMDNCDRYFCLTHHKQSDELQPYQKTRTVFFIFFEQVVQRILQKQHS